MTTIFPSCPKCKRDMVPLSDFGDGAAVLVKAWACINPQCGFLVRIDKGVVTYATVGHHNHGPSGHK